MALLLMVLSIFMALISTFAHQENAISDMSKTSDDMEEEQILRRYMDKREWQYEGIPIELPSRRNFNVKITSQSSTIKTTLDPPLNRRYRRIYNADEIANIEDFPFLAALLVNKKLWCGGAIIDTDKVLTAAHCLQLQYNNRFFREYVKMLTVRVGSSNATSGGELYRVTEIFFHPNYKPNTLEFNFAVLRLHKNISYEHEDTNVAKIDFSTDKNVPTDSNITFLGWGSVLVESCKLNLTHFPVFDLAEILHTCPVSMTMRVYNKHLMMLTRLAPYGEPGEPLTSTGGLGGQVLLQKDLVTRTNFCAGYITLAKNVCNHDAGGPAIMDGLLVGILSFSAKRCDRTDQPAVFSTVGAIAPWLDSLGERKMKLP